MSDFNCNQMDCNEQDTALNAIADAQATLSQHSRNHSNRKENIMKTKKKRRSHPIFKQMPTELREACNTCRWGYIPEEKLGQAIAALPKMDKKVAVLINLENAFRGLVENFRELDVHCGMDEGNGMSKRIYVPLLPSLELLGLAIPARVEGVDYYLTVEDFCEKIGVSGMYWADNDCYVRSENILFLIRAAGYPQEIERRFVEWFQAFVNERKAGMGWRIALFAFRPKQPPVL